MDELKQALTELLDGTHWHWHYIMDDNAIMVENYKKDYWYRIYISTQLQDIVVLKMNNNAVCEWFDVYVNVDEFKDYFSL